MVSIAVASVRRPAPSAWLRTSQNWGRMVSFFLGGWVSLGLVWFGFVLCLFVVCVRVWFAVVVLKKY